MKLKTCKHCKLDLPLASFTSTQAKYCKKCKYIVALQKKHESTLRQLERTKNKKQKNKGVIRVSDLKKQAQKVFNKWIRERDKQNGCISCGNTNASSYEAGHFLAQGSTGALRYHEDNVHKQCYSCNHFKHANLIEYRINLLAKIGKQRVEWLEEHRKDIKKWQREELNEIIERYKL